MHDSTRVRERERARDIAKHRNGVAHTRRPHASEVCCERLSLDVRHDEVRNAVHFTGAKNSDDVRMLQLGDGKDLAPKRFADTPSASSCGRTLITTFRWSSLSS